MLQELFQEPEQELGRVIGVGGTHVRNDQDPEGYELLILNEMPCLTQPTKRSICLRESAMRHRNAVSWLINALAPVNKPPPEILGMIPKYEDDQTSGYLVAVPSVCSYWRNTFITTPSLWTGLYGEGVEKSRTWVQRSGALPMRLSRLKVPPTPK